MQRHHAEDESLVARCIAHSPDRYVLNELIQRYGRLVMQTITWTLKRYSVIQKEEAEDVFQDVFVSLFENDAGKLKKYDPGRAGLGTFLASIARNSAINALKKRKKGMVEISENVIDEDEGFLLLEDAEIMEKIRNILAGCTAQERLFFHLYFEECMPPESVANVMGVAIDSIYSKKAKIVEKIKNHMRSVIKEA